MKSQDNTVSDLRLRVLDTAGAADHDIGKVVFAVNLQALPGAEMRSAVSMIQDVIESALPAGQFRIPRRALHMTVIPILWVRGNYPGGAAQLWPKIAKPVHAGLRSLVKSAPSFSLLATGVELRSAAIVLRFHVSRELDEIRASAAAALQPLGVTAHVPDIAHMTLFRYRTAFDFRRRADRLKSTRFPGLTWRIEGLVLFREEVYPSLEGTVLHEYDLQSHSN